MLTVSLVVALLIDRVFGEPARCHPLVGFGRLVMGLENRARRFQGSPDSADMEIPGVTLRQQKLLGAMCWLLLILLPTGALYLLLDFSSESVATLLGIVVLYFCLGAHSLAQHARAIVSPLLAGDLPAARQQLSRIVSRDTAELESNEIAGAALESVLENGSDAVLAPIFWFLLAGAPGVLFYRLANTLDAMWGYRTPRYRYFGYTAARMDDLLNWVPARLCALSYALAGNFSRARHCWQSQAWQWDSPNAGPVMAAGAGALGVQLGGTAHYHAEARARPVLGEGDVAGPADVERGLSLLFRATCIWLLICGFVEFSVGVLQ